MNMMISYQELVRTFLEENLFSGLTALSAEFTIGEGELMAHDVPLGCAPDEYDDLISGTCSHLP